MSHALEGGPGRTEILLGGELKARVKAAAGRRGIAAVTREALELWLTLNDDERHAAELASAPRGPDEPLDTPVFHAPTVTGRGLSRRWTMRCGAEVSDEDIVRHLRRSCPGGHVRVQRAGSGVLAWAMLPEYVQQLQRAGTWAPWEAWQGAEYGA